MDPTVKHRSTWRAQFNDAQIAAIVIAYGADFNAKYGLSGHTPLSWAVTCNALECARELVKVGARPDLFCAGGIGLLEHVLLDHVADAFLANGDGKTALDIATELGHAAAAEVLRNASAG